MRTSNLLTSRILGLLLASVLVIEVVPPSYSYAADDDELTLDEAPAAPATKAKPKSTADAKKAATKKVKAKSRKVASEDAEELDPDLQMPEAASTSFEKSSVDVDSLNDQLSALEEKIKITKAQISKIKDASFLPDLYFSLADMHVQKSRLLYVIKTEENKGKSVDQLDFTVEKRPKQEAIDIYQKIYSFFPKYTKRDKALFLKGLELRDLGRLEEMVRTFTQLSQEFPSSDFYNEANIIIGDFYFETKKDPGTAVIAFQRVVSRPISPFTPVAHYRIGWCLINEHKNKEAVQSFEEAINQQAFTSSSDLPEVYRKTDIRREAVMALVVPYIEVFTDPENKAPADMVTPVTYFERKSPDHFTFRRVSSRAGRRLILKERWQEAADAFFNVLVLSTDFDSRFEALQRIADAHRRKPSRLDFLALARETAISVDYLQASQNQPMDVRNLVYNPKTKATSAVARARHQLSFLELFLRDVATQLHGQAKTSGSPADYDRAAQAYELYLERFAKAPKSPLLRLNLAESYFNANKLVKAGMTYEQLARIKGLKKRNSDFNESAVESYSKALQNYEQLSSIERIWARRGLREVGGAWLKANLRKPSAPTVGFNIANSWYEERDLRKAIDSFKAYIKLFPRDEKVRDAIFTIINSYSQLDDYKGLQKDGALLLKTAGLSSTDQTAIQDAIRRAQSKQLQTMAGNLGAKDYAEQLLSVASKYKGSALGVQALYEAFVTLRSKNDPELFEVGEALLDQHGENQYAKEVASSMATLALSTASFDRAARYLSRFADKYPTEKESQDFRKTAAALFERQGDFKRARSQYAKLGDRGGIASMDLALADWGALEKSSVASGTPNSNYWHALAVWRQKRYNEAIPLLKAVAVDSSLAADQSGHAKFLLSQLALLRFRGIKMKSAEDQNALAEKAKAFQQLSGELQKMVTGGAGRWPVAALYVLGQAHYDLGRFIADSPIPAGLSANDRKAYIDELQKQAGAYLGEAKNVFGKCVEVAQANDLFTRYVDGCRAGGTKLIREEEDLARPQAKSASTEPPRAREIRKKIFENGKDTNLLMDLADTYLNADQPQTAFGIYSRVLEIDENNARAIASQGVASMYLNDFESAYGYFKKALDMNGSESVALWNLGGLYKHFGFDKKLAAFKAKARGTSRPRILHPFAKEL